MLPECIGFTPIVSRDLPVAESASPPWGSSALSAHFGSTWRNCIGYARYSKPVVIEKTIAIHAITPHKQAAPQKNHSEGLDGAHRDWHRDGSGARGGRCGEVALAVLVSTKCLLPLQPGS